MDDREPPSFRDGTYRGLEFGLRLERRGRRYLPLRVREPVQVYRFMRELSEESAEHAYTLNMSGAHHVVGVYRVGKGGISSCSVDPREVYKAALKANATGVILVHNHPSGEVEPSRDDIQIGRQLRDAGSVLNVRFIDSIIIGDGRYLSMAERGLLRD